MKIFFVSSTFISLNYVFVAANVIISIECRAWAGNIEYRGGSLNRAGSVTFEIQVDAETYFPYQNTQSTNMKSEAPTTATTVTVNRTASS